MRNIVVFTGNAHPELAEKICGHAGVPLSPATFEWTTGADQQPAT